MVKLIDESKARKTVNKRSIKEDYGDWEIIAKFRSKPFCIGDIDSVEDDLIDLMNTDEVAFKQIVDYLKSEGYSVGGEDFDADDYADWFTRELNDLFSVHNESDLKFGYFDFKVKNLSAYYDESIKRNKIMTENSDVNDAVMNDVLKKVKKFGIKCDELAELMASVYFIIKYDTRSLVSFTPDQAERICAELDKLYDILDTNVKIPDDLYDLIDEIPSSSKIGQGYDVFY